MIGQIIVGFLLVVAMIIGLTAAGFGGRLFARAVDTLHRNWDILDLFTWSAMVLGGIVGIVQLVSYYCGYPSVTGLPIFGSMLSCGLAGAPCLVALWCVWKVLKFSFENLAAALDWLATCSYDVAVRAADELWELITPTSEDEEAFERSASGYIESVVVRRWRKKIFIIKLRDFPNAYFASESVACELGLAEVDNFITLRFRNGRRNRSRVTYFAFGSK